MCYPSWNFLVSFTCPSLTHMRCKWDRYAYTHVYIYTMMSLDWLKHSILSCRHSDWFRNSQSQERNAKRYLLGPPGKQSSLSPAGTEFNDARTQGLQMPQSFPSSEWRLDLPQLLSPGKRPSHSSMTNSARVYGGLGHATLFYALFQNFKRTWY